MTFKQLPAYISEMIRYQKALAAMNGIQLTSWQALNAGIVTATKSMLEWLVTNPWWYSYIWISESL